MSNLPKIMVFDSGAGGLTISKELILRLPALHLIFVSDKTYFPYGDKPDSELIVRICNQMEHMISTHKPDLVVVACNTASTIALNALRQRFTTPFVGVVPAIKPAVKLSKTGVIGLLATPATSNRQYTHQLIEDFAKDSSVVIHGSKSLVTEAELCLIGKIPDYKLLETELNTLFAMPRGEQIDTIVLACTHFPLLRSALNEIAEQLNKTITWVDSGEAIARRVASLLHLDYQPNIGSSSRIGKATTANSVEFIDCDINQDLSAFIPAAYEYLFQLN